MLWNKLDALHKMISMGELKAGGGGAVGEVLVVDDPKELSGEIEKDEGDASWNPLAQNTERDIKGVFQANLQQSLVITPESKDTSKCRWWVLITKL